MKERVKSIKRFIEDQIKQASFGLKPPEKRRNPFPDFLCIGAQKSGTTWLQDCLIHHPEIFLPAEKEVHFFDWKYFMPYRWYQKKFTDANGRLIGEITPGYSTISTKRIEHIARFNPNAKIILLLRNPIERAWSHSKMVLCKIQGKPFQSISNKEWIAHFNGVKSQKRGAYVEVYKKWSEIFGEDQVFVGFYEQIANEPEVLLRSIMTFLGVSSDIDLSSMPFDRRANVGIQDPIPSDLRHFLEEKYRSEIEECCNVFGENACGWL